MKNDKFAYWLAAAVLVAGVSNNHQSNRSLQLRQVVASVHARANFLEAKVREQVGLVKCLVGRGTLPNTLEASQRLLDPDREMPSLEAAQQELIQPRLAEFSDRSAIPSELMHARLARMNSRLTEVRTARSLRVVRCAHIPAPTRLRIVEKSSD